MVLKKPYAFLIKHFKLIHLLLCLPLLYLLIKTHAISQFLSSYIMANYTTSEVNLSGIYLNYFMYLAVLVVLISTISIIFLMRQKEKSTFFYYIILVFYIILFILITLSYGVFSSIEDSIISAQTVRLYRDLSYAAYIPQYFVLGYTLLRGIGFNLKQFDFEDDMRELEIYDNDDEEFELQFGKDFYKYQRGFRRFIREFKYYFQENLVVFIGLSAVLVVTLGTILYLNFNVYHPRFRSTQRISHNGLLFQVVDTELSNLDYGGRVIGDKYYMAIALKIQNKGKEDVNLDYQNFKLKYNKSYILPTLDRGSYFIDLGVPYTRDTKIAKNSEGIYVLTYEIEPSLINKKFSLRILESLESTIGGITPTYKEIKLKYNIVKENKEIDTYDLGKILVLNKTRAGLSQVQFKDYNILKTYTYDYQSCTNDRCRDLKGMVTANPVTYGANKTLLVLKRMITLDKTTPYYKSTNTINGFARDCFTLRYTINGKQNVTSLINVTPSELKDEFVFVVPSDIEKSDRIDILVTLRGSIYVMNIK